MQPGCRQLLIGRGILGDDRPGSDNGSLAYYDAGHDHCPHAGPGAVADYGVTLSFVRIQGDLRERIKAEPIRPMRVVAAHQADRLRADTRALADGSFPFAARVLLKLTRFQLSVGSRQ